MKLIASNIKLPIEHKEDDIYKATVKALRISPDKLSGIRIKSKSIDARNKNDIKFIYTVEANVSGNIKIDRLKNVSRYTGIKYSVPNKSTYDGRPVIIGFGPAGLFCAYILVLAGLKPIILERGHDVDRRHKDIEEFWKNGVLNPDSNVQYGEGGAGTFSDGKLNTLVKDKKGRCSFVLETFVKFGAPSNILYDSKPHVGTDILIDVIRKMREFICENGGEVFFDSKVTKLNISGGRIAGVEIAEKNKEIFSDRVVLAIGHSARDTFYSLNEIGINMSPKAFAVGFRVEHPRKFINKSQYGYEDNPYLKAAPYKLTAQSLLGRGVYTFCMCPGGYVVNSSSEEGMIAVNGMSYSGRNGDNSNTAVIVTVNPEDFDSEGVLGGIEYQRSLERKAYDLGNGNVPVQRYGDFVKAINSKCKTDYNVSDYSLMNEYPLFTPQIKGKYTETDLDSILDDKLNQGFIEGMTKFGTMIKGYNSPDIYMSGIESRTSSPVRIWREENGESTSVKGLYPCGEGAGYAGGITSAAMDGMLIAEKIINS